LPMVGAGVAPARQDQNIGFRDAHFRLDLVFSNSLRRTQPLAVAALVRYVAAPKFEGICLKDL